MTRSTTHHGRRRAGRSTNTSVAAHSLPTRRRHAASRSTLPGNSAWLTAAATGLGTTALAASLLVPGAHASMDREDAFTAVRASAAVSPPPVTADASAELDFGRSSVSSQPAPEPKVVKTTTVKHSHIAPAQETPAAVNIATAEAPALQDDALLRAPLAQMVMTSPFGERINPLTGDADEMHTGMDFGGSCNTPVAASGAGTVVEAGWHPYGGGKRIVIDHGDGLQTTYNHLAKIDVELGQSVPEGQRIAAMGTTGNSTGCHLHFEVILDGQNVDPADWLF